MATAYGVNAAKYLDPALVPANKQPVAGGDQAGRPAIIYDQFTIPAAGAGSAQNDVVVMGRLYKNQRVVGMDFHWDAAGASVTFAVGDDGSAARYRAAASGTAAGQGGITANAGMGFVVDQDRNILVTIGGAAPTPGAVLRLATRVIHV